MNLKLNKGFTLIELMVTIAIIGILSGIGITSFTGARLKANDAKRRSDLVQLRNALEQYASDKGSYPSTSGNWYSSDPNEIAGVPVKGGNWIPGLAPTYIKSLPADPVGGTGLSSLTPGCSGWSKSYLYRSIDGAGYELLAHCSGEAMSMNDIKDGLFDPTRYNDVSKKGWAWKVCSGVECGQ